MDAILGDLEAELGVAMPGAVIAAQKDYPLFLISNSKDSSLVLLKHASEQH